MSNNDIGVLIVFTGGAFYTLFLLYTRKNVVSDKEQIENQINITREVSLTGCTSYPFA